MTKKEIDNYPLVHLARIKLGESHSPIGGWLQITLMLAGIYNMLWGAWAIFFPQSYFSLSGMDPLNHPQIWQCLGMVIGLYGLGYFIASTDIIRYWPLVFIGLLGKIFGPIGYLHALYLGEMPLSGVWLIFFNDIIWWYPFSLMLYLVYLQSKRTQKLSDSEERSLSFLNTLSTLSDEKPVLLILLRHLGCTFSREMISILNSELPALRTKGIKPVIVHMGSEENFSFLTKDLELHQDESFFDPDLCFYRIFSIRKASLIETFSFKTWMRAWQAGIVSQCKIGPLKGDGFQLAGLVLLQNGEIASRYQYRSVSDAQSFISFVEPSSESV